MMCNLGEIVDLDIPYMYIFSIELRFVGEYNRSYWSLALFFQQVRDAYFVFTWKRLFGPR